MDLHIRLEFLIAAGIASATLIVAFLWLLVWFVKHLTSFAQALKAGSDVNTELNKELLANIKERHREREDAELARDTLRVDFDTQLRKLRADAEQTSALQSAEIVKMKGKQASAEAVLSQLQGENTRLQARVTTLEREGLQKDKKIADLQIALDQSEKDKQELSQAMTALQEKLNLKADKPEPEAGERLSPAPEVSKETTHDGTN